jgi:hypothetical protein
VASVFQGAHRIAGDPPVMGALLLEFEFRHFARLTPGLIWCSLRPRHNQCKRDWVPSTLPLNTIHHHESGNTGRRGTGG